MFARPCTMLLVVRNAPPRDTRASPPCRAGVCLSPASSTVLSWRRTPAVRSAVTGPGPTAVRPHTTKGRPAVSTASRTGHVTRRTTTTATGSSTTRPPRRRGRRRRPPRGPFGDGPTRETPGRALRLAFHDTRPVPRVKAHPASRLAFRTWAPPRRIGLVTRPRPGPRPSFPLPYWLILDYPRRDLLRRARRRDPLHGHPRHHRALPL